MTTTLDRYILNASGIRHIPFFTELVEHVGAKAANATNTTNTTQRLSNRVRAIFLAAGWCPDYIHNALQGLHDRLLTETHEEREIANGLAVLWLAKQNMARHSLSRSMMNIGVSREHAVAVTEALFPLADSCYTTDQLKLMAIEYLLDNGINNNNTNAEARVE